jgi:hypothetical protein
MTEEKKIRTEERKIRYENGCIKDTDLVFLLKKNTKKKKLIGIERLVHSDILGDMMRVFVPFEIETYDRVTDITTTHPMLVDSVTGSMYDKMTGQCMSSTRLKLGD